MRKNNEIAADMIPIRLIMSVVIVAAILLISFFGYNYLKVIIAENNIENDCRALESKLYSMLASGTPRDVDEVDTGDGTRRHQTFNIPENIIYLSFGVDPDPDNDGALKTGITQTGAVIFYRVQDSSKKIIWLDDNFRFREGKFYDDKWIINGLGQGFIIKEGGKIKLNFELVEKNHNLYILIRQTDSIDI